MNTLVESIIRNHPFFAGMKPYHFGMLSKGATQELHKAGDVLFREGDPANRMYLIQKGEVLLETHDPAGASAPVQTLQAGDVIGWSWLFPPYTWHLSARALEETSVVVLDGGHLLVAAEQHHDFGYELMKRVAQLTVQRLQATRKQLLSAGTKLALHA